MYRLISSYTHTRCNYKGLYVGLMSQTDLRNVTRRIHIPIIQDNLFLCLVVFFFLTINGDTNAQWGVEISKVSHVSSTWVSVMCAVEVLYVQKLKQFDAMVNASS